MAQVTYCKSCGAYIPEGQNKCLACGSLADFPSLDGNPYSVKTTNLEKCQALLFELQMKEHADKEHADIDMDALMDMRFFTVKIGGVVSKYYFGDRPKTTLFPMDEIELGRTIDGRIIYGGTCGAKRIIDLKLIER